MKIAMYKSIAHGTEVVLQASDWMEREPTYSRISEIIEADFPPRAADEVIASQLAGLEILEAKVNAEHSEKLSAIKAKRAELAALTWNRPVDANDSTVLQ